MMKQLPLLPLLPLLLLFSLLTGNSSACKNGVSKVISTEGTDVMLPCSPSIRENLQKKLFDWKKVGQGGAAQHEVFMWDSADHYHDHSGQSEQFKGRVSHFQNELQHGNASIVIRETKVIDSGSYSCFFPRQPSEKFCIELVVGASPKPSVTILEETKDWSRLQCEVNGAHPEPKVEWRDSSGNILPAEEPQVSKTGDRYSVALNTTVTKTDRYQCVATQEEIKHQSRPAHIYVLLNGASSKPSVTILEETKDRALLQCEVNGAFPKPLLQWTDSSGTTLNTEEPQVSESGGSYDVILNITVTKTDRYQCVASQEEIKSKPAHIYVSLSDPSGGFSVAGVLGIILFVVVFVCIVVAVLVCTGRIPLICNNVGKKGNASSSKSPAAKSEDSETVQLKI